MKFWDRLRTLISSSFLTDSDNFPDNFLFTSSNLVVLSWLIDAKCRWFRSKLQQSVENKKIQPPSYCSRLAMKSRKASRSCGWHIKSDLRFRWQKKHTNSMRKMPHMFFWNKTIIFWKAKKKKFWEEELVELRIEQKPIRNLREYVMGFMILTI